MTWKPSIKKSFIIGMAMATLMPAVSQAYGEASVIQGYVERQSLVPMIKPSWGNFILHTDTLNKLYSLRGFNAIWVDSAGRPNQMVTALKTYLQSVDRHGLYTTDYWDAEIENLFAAAKSNPKNWITFELAVSEAVIRFANHISTGRFDPESIDTDIKFKQKTFNEYNDLISALGAGASGLAAGLDRLAPTHSRYGDLMKALSRLRVLKTQGGWEVLVSPGYPLKKGVTAPVIGQLRARLNQLGYTVSNAGGNLFDAELDTVVRDFQAKNGLTVDGIIGTRSEVLRVLNYTVNQRISQVEVNMEKLRWLPRTLENRHIFVNLATSEFRLFEGSQKVFDFKTINGQSFRRTPSMRDLLYRIILNPTWTVPNSIAVRDKIPMLQKDPGYLAKHNMVLLDSSTEQQVDPYSIDWQNTTVRNFSYFIRQNPGYDNALGVMKFDLQQNPWAIYLHDTNERWLFAETNRLRSSGCVRLEKPMDLAEYLVRDVPDWDRAALTAAVPSRKEKVSRTPISVSLGKQAVPVYMMFLTVEKTDNGALRFVDDLYGQDMRVAKAIQNKKINNELF
ncbi:murein L,D-transpeptidase [compost metagenome]